MAGISQVWLTEKELTALDKALSTLPEWASLGYLLTPDFVSGADKIKMALEPVACKV